MDLLSKLIAAGRQIPPTHLPSVNDLVPVVAALVMHVEHGPQFLATLDQGEGAVHAFLDSVAQAQQAASAPQQPAAVPATATTIAGAVPAAAAPQQAPQPVPAGVPVAQPSPVQPAPAGAVSDAELVAQIEALQAQLADRQRATVTTTPLL